MNHALEFLWCRRYFLLNLMCLLFYFYMPEGNYWSSTIIEGNKSLHKIFSMLQLKNLSYSHFFPQSSVPWIQMSISSMSKIPRGAKLNIKLSPNFARAWINALSLYMAFWDHSHIGFFSTWDWNSHFVW